MTAYNLILENKEKVEKIANTILEEKEIYGDDLVRLLDEQNFQRPEIDWTDEAVWPKFMNWTRDDATDREAGKGGDDKARRRRPCCNERTKRPPPRTGRARRSPQPDRSGRQAATQRGSRLIYAGLGVVLVAAIVGLVVLVDRIRAGTASSASGWSTGSRPTARPRRWPRRSPITSRGEYHLNKKGTQLVAVVSGPPQVTSGTHKVTISNHRGQAGARQSDKGIQIVPSGEHVDRSALRPRRRAARSRPARRPRLRGRLVRREALEVALYTFKFVPAIKSIVAFMPPPAGSTAVDAPLPAEGRTSRSSSPSRSRRRCRSRSRRCRPRRTRRRRRRSTS